MMFKLHAPAFAAVLLLHGAALWALQNGLLQRVQEAITPPEMLVEIMEAEPAPELSPISLRPTPQKPEKTAATAPAKPVMAQPKQPLVPPPPLQKPQPAPLAVATAQPSALPAPVAAAAPQNTPTASVSPSAASASASATTNSANNSAAHTPTTATPPAPALQLPSSDADYLNNPKPSYPAMSRRLGEQGNVVVHTLIGADGVPQKAEILRSSGFERLDRAALETALKWRYMPGKRAGVAEAMWFKVPLRFVLD
jgi:protein TonB